MAKILVLGGNGFIGRNLLNTLIEKKHEVYSFDLHCPTDMVEGVTYMSGDFFDDYVLGHAIEGMDIIYHAICTVNPGNSNDKCVMGYERDLIQTIKLCEKLKNSDTKMVFLSSGGTVYGKQDSLPVTEETLPVPINHYGNLKLCIENAMRVYRCQNGSKFVIARIANPYGPGQDYRKGVGFIDAAIKHAMFDETIEIWGKGNVVRDYIYITDVCMALAMLGEIDVPYDVVNISSGVGVSQQDIIKVIKKHYPDVNVQYQPARSVDADKIYLCNGRLKEIWQHDFIGIEEGIEKYFDYLKKMEVIQ